MENNIFNEFEKINPNFENIKYIIINSKNINTRNNRGETFLMCAINHINQIKWLDKNGNLAENGDESIKLVQKTVPKMDVSIIKWLLEMGCDPNIEDNDGDRCIRQAVFTFRSDIFELLLNYGAKINFEVHNGLKFSKWMKIELDEFGYDGNRIAYIEIAKMVEMINKKMNENEIPNST